MLLVVFLWTLPDGKLRITYCDVGQGDAAYIRFPDGRDMLIDAGPGASVLQCLGREMPFWDRTIDLVLLSHPEHDHIGGLPEIIARYTVGQILRSDVAASGDGYRDLMQNIAGKNIPVSYVGQGSTVEIGDIQLRFLWPDTRQLAYGIRASAASAQADNEVLGAGVSDNLNDFSTVFLLTFRDFDAFFPGDADNRINSALISQSAGSDPVEILKVPHHGSRTGMTPAYLKWLRPSLAVISVGKNTYGHPAPEIRELLESAGIPFMRTDRPEGDIRIVTDGRGWQIF
ncbi:hypothetical protein A2Z33_01765 [Candidatus Gottesmanbacteria bacterium RBG_16_52_11]|uniref:Metallo-beta-lactamase domain-containing protein n=1 Tax=Candidatus Gottesmanbacteria bacterium RBG_16_52_11 TaxID=1798374 RepID=A0A1F5YQX6_9BACT|nr:MAG: hypothetical protein A2Z33_01765 [Candidatus Gottesmanbacteria bacterium RBG_16_52_11]